MRWSQNKKNRIKVEFTTPNDRNGNSSGVPNARSESGRQSSKTSLWSLLGSGINRWFVAGKYQTHRVQRSWLTRSNILWLKIGVAGFAILMVMRNDFQFTINLSGDEAAVQQEESASVDKMSLAHSVALKPTKSTSAEREVATAKTNRWRTKAVRERNTNAGSAFKARSVSDYVDHYSDLAKEEMRRFGIPASFKMAQAILASEAGAKPTYNNHFGRHLKGINFEDASTNWRAHSLYLIENYPELLKSGSTYMDWVKALENTDYSFDAAYTQQLLSVIQEYKLYQLDY